jgi:YqaJ-like viral recombinase domain
MKIHPAEQGSVEWGMARAGIPTASEFDNLITPKWEVKKGKGPYTYMTKKLAERWRGTPLLSFRSLSMEFGNILEDEAVPWYELQHNVEIQRVGLVTTDDGKIGCSPDGLLGDDGGIEIKCPEPHTHVDYLLNGELPDDYSAQVHGAMLVTGRPVWTFMSYCRGFPTFILEVQRDDKIQEALQEALDAFVERLDDAWEMLVNLNGGPPRRRPVPMAPVEAPTYAMGDDIVP